MKVTLQLLEAITTASRKNGVKSPMPLGRKTRLLHLLFNEQITPSRKLSELKTFSFTSFAIALNRSSLINAFNISAISSLPISLSPAQPQSLSHTPNPVSWTTSAFTR